MGERPALLQEELPMPDIEPQTRSATALILVAGLGLALIVMAVLIALLGWWGPLFR
jgi:hypothetical protein